MSTSRNDSSKMKDVLQPDLQLHKHDKQEGAKENDGKGKNVNQEENTGKHKSEKEANDKQTKDDGDDKNDNKQQQEKHNSNGSSSQACCSCACSGFSSSGPSSAADVRHTERNSLQREQATSSCCLLQDLGRLPECDSTLEELRYSVTHTVLIDVLYFNRHKEIRPQTGREIWHSNFVKMPCSQSSHIVKSGIMTSNQVRRWDVISKQLKSLATKREVDVGDVAHAIMKYNPKYEKQWSFDGLASFVKCIRKEENYFPTLFPKIAGLALRLPELLRKAIPLLKSGHAASITLSQHQIACLLANAFFCTFPHRNTSKPNTEYYGYPTINFNSLFGHLCKRKTEKLRAIMHYFKVVTESEPKGLVTFERRYLNDSDLPNWRSCKEKMPKLHVTSEGTIEKEGKGMLQVDFAANLIGGGVLGSGLVQEEILFIINPELIVSRLFTQKLEDRECLIITGSQQFSIYFGFGESFEWGGPCTDTLKRDEWGRLQRQIVAIDALHFKHANEQYNMAKVKRELNKAYCGFKKNMHKEPDIATGKWGCGAFNGDPQLKALIQLMAAAKATRGLAFFTFQDHKLKHELEQMYSLLVTKEVTVDKLYGLLEDYCTDRCRYDSHMDLFGFIRERLQHLSHL